MTEPLLLLGDCVERMRELATDSIDAIVCDPPYGLGFMGKDWDSPGGTGDFPMRRSDAQNIVNTGVTRQGGRQRSGEDFVKRQARDARAFQEWAESWAVEMLRVLKPGGHALVFGGTRTYHRLASGIEDAGFEVRDCLAWMYGSGFPKSLDVAKAVDRAQGVEGGRGEMKRGGERLMAQAPGGVRDGGGTWGDESGRDPYLYVPGSDAGRDWQGWGTALKPAFEPIVVARKPLTGTVAANVLAHGVGAINVDACRVAFAGADDEAETGRWPANVLLGHHEDCVELGPVEVRGTGHTPASRPSSGFAANAQPEEVERDWRRETVVAYDCVPDCPVRLLDEQTGELTSGRLEPHHYRGQPRFQNTYGSCDGSIRTTERSFGGDSGGASRFFYCAKVSRAERNAGLDDQPDRIRNRVNPGGIEHDPKWAPTVAKNHHPTVKPLDLMRWLIRLVTPPGGTILDPFLGSGSTGCAATLEGAAFVGIERDPDYMRVAEARIRFWAEHGEQALEVVRARDRGETDRRAVEDAGQLTLLG